MFHYVLDCIYKYRITFVLKKIYPVLFHSFKTNIPDNYEYDFNWLMNDLGVHNLKKINEDLNSRKVKAMLYQKHLSEKKIYKFNFLGKENIFLEYPVMLKNFTNLEMHKILFERGYDIRHTWYINNSLEVNKNLVFENTDYVAKNIFCLPTHKNISEKDIINICNIVNSHG